jgi:Acetoacetate decarboxylase (ADC)
VPAVEYSHLVGHNDQFDGNRAPILAAFNGSLLKVEDADVHYCLLEIPVAQALTALPPALHPSIPGVIATLHYHCPNSDIGAFDLLTTAIFCRSAAKHRMLTLSAFTDSAKAQAFFRDGWGYAAALAEIRLAIHYDRVRSTVAQGGKVLLDVVTNDPVALTGPGASVRYAQSLNYARTPQGLKLIQVDASYDFKRSARGTARFHAYDAAALGDPNHAPTDPVCGTLVRANVAFDPVRYIADPYVTAEGGGISMTQPLDKTVA